MIRRITNRDLRDENSDSLPERYKEIEFNNGHIVMRHFSPRGYTKQNGEKADAWLPEIAVIKIDEKAPARISIHDVIAPRPSQIYEIFFTPSWNKNEEYHHRLTFICRFPKAFIPDKNDKNQTIGDIVVFGINLTEECSKNNMNPGRVDYSADVNRDHLYHVLGPLGGMLRHCASDPVKNSYELTFSAPVCATGKLQYLLRITDEEAAEFEKNALKIPFFQDRIPVY